MRQNSKLLHIDFFIFENIHFSCPKNIYPTYGLLPAFNNFMFFFKNKKRNILKSTNFGRYFRYFLGNFYKKLHLFMLTHCLIHHKSSIAQPEPPVQSPVGVSIIIVKISTMYYYYLLSIYAEKIQLLSPH